MENKHIPVMLEEVKSFIPKSKKINVIDATFGAGGYSSSIIKEFKVKQLIAIDRDPISEIFAKELKNKHINFKLVNDKFSNIDKIIKEVNSRDKKYDVIIFDLGVSSNQLENPNRGFSFKELGPLDMNMGEGDKKAYDIVNLYEEKKIAKIIFELGEEKFSRRIAKNIVLKRQTKIINDTLELAKIVCDTSYYGWLINYAQMSKMIAKKYNVDYDEMWSFSDEIQKFLGNRPKMFPGFIGGHCVIPNLQLIDENYLDPINKINNMFKKFLSNS